jgi:hypothetical protein
MARVKLTKAAVDALEAPEIGQAFVWDSEMKGFAVRITPTGVKSWIVQMMVRGAQKRRITIGQCSRVPLDQARIEARKLLAHADIRFQSKFSIRSMKTSFIDHKNRLS